MFVPSSPGRVLPARDLRGGGGVNVQIINNAPGVAVEQQRGSDGNPTFIVRQIEGALAMRAGKRQSALGRAANAGLRG
jgi:hypothetical protein